MPGEAKAWVLMNGSVLCVDHGFTSALGWLAAESIGNELVSLMHADPEQVGAVSHTVCHQKAQ